MIDICKHPTSFTELGFHLINWDKHPLLREMDRDKALRHRNEAYQQQVSDLLGLFDISLNVEAINLLDDSTINEQDDWGRIRLHRAVFYGKTGEFNKLLSLGADITLKDDGGLTPLELVRSLQQRFTYTVSPTCHFFSGSENTVRVTNCAVWKKFEQILEERSQLLWKKLEWILAWAECLQPHRLKLSTKIRRNCIVLT